MSETGNTAVGDGWELRLGDCLAGMENIGDASVDVIITDPPYSEHTHKKQWTSKALTDDAQIRGKVSKSGRAYDAVSSGHAGLNFEHITNDQAAQCCQEWFRIARRWVLVFCDLEGIELWRREGVEAGFDYVRTCVWDKVDGAPQFTGDRPAAGAEAIVVLHRPGKKFWNGGGRRNVFRFEVNGERGEKPHPTTKPLSLMRELVQLFSNPGELVLDPFSGSGSTGVACKQTARRFLGFELSPEYFEIATRRLSGNEARPSPNQPSLFGGAT